MSAEVTGAEELSATLFPRDNDEGPVAAGPPHARDNLRRRQRRRIRQRVRCGHVVGIGGAGIGGAGNTPGQFGEGEADNDIRR